MKTRTRELAKPGIFGTVDNPIVVNEKDLREIAETFPEIKTAPVSLNGHWPDPARPRMGNVISVTFDETTKILSGAVEEQDALADAVDQGFFPDVSIGSKRRASDGKMYLHHLAYLGEEPPAIKDLVKAVLGSLEQPAPAAIAAADEAKDCLMIPPATSHQLVLSDPAATNPHPGQLPGNHKEVPMNLEEALAALEEQKKKVSTLEGENTQIKGQLSKLAEKYPDAGIQLSDSDNPQLRTLTTQLRSDKTAAVLQAANGKIPKAKHGLVSALAGQLSIGQTIELSDANGTKTTVSGLDVMKQLLDAIPSPVEPGKLDLSDADKQDKPIDMANIMARV